MTETTLQRTLRRVQHVVCGALMTGLLLGATLAFAEKPPDTLIVWAGDKAHEAPDFLAVIDFDSHSPHYGKILRIVPLPARVLGAGAVGNEPHHVGLSRDGRTLALGGLLSFLRSQAQVFFFDVTKPRHPKFIGSNNPSNASITDEFASLSTGGVSRDVYGRPGWRSSRACGGI